MSKLYTNAFAGNLTLIPTVPVKKELNISLLPTVTSLEFRLHPIDLSLFKEYPPREDRIPFIDTSYIEACFVFDTCLLNREEKLTWQRRYLYESVVNFDGNYKNITLYEPGSITKYNTEIEFNNKPFTIRYFKKQYCLTTTIPSKDVKELLIPECKRMSEEQ